MGGGRGHALEAELLGGRRAGKQAVRGRRLHGNGDYLSSVERFDPEAGHWEEVSGMESERGFLGAAVL